MASANPLILAGRKTPWQSPQHTSQLELQIDQSMGLRFFYIHIPPLVIENGLIIEAHQTIPVMWPSLDFSMGSNHFMVSPGTLKLLIHPPMWYPCILQWVQSTLLHSGQDSDASYINYISGNPPLATSLLAQHGTFSSVINRTSQKSPLVQKCMVWVHNK